MGSRPAHEMFEPRYTYWRKISMYEKRDKIYTRIFFCEINQIVLYEFLGYAKLMDPNVN